jgi:glycogen operon protein
MDAGIHWFDQQGGSPKWDDPKEKHCACLIHEDEQRALCLLFNAGADAVDFRLPPIPSGAQWHVAVDTFGESPHDLFAAGKEPLLQYPQIYLLQPRSSAILLTRKPESPVGGGFL